jgi:hypothetical protein
MYVRVCTFVSGRSVFVCKTTEANVVSIGVFVEPLAVGLIALGCVFGGALLGIFCRRWVPDSGLGTAEDSTHLGL